jgi:hypothetical protein
VKPEETFGNSAGFLLGLLVDLEEEEEEEEEEGDMFHRNVGRFSSLHGVIF